MSEKRKSSLLGKITVFFVICCFCLPAQAKYGGGTGEPNDPYLIYDANHMQAIGADANDWEKCFKLMSDIDLRIFDGNDGRPEFNIIGYVAYDPYTEHPFKGVFDGNDHTISNLTYNANDRNFIGLFGVVGDGEIKNLGLINPEVRDSDRFAVSSLVGLNAGTITNCYAEGSTVTGYAGVGGLVGWNRGNIVHCNASGTVTGIGMHVGGLVAESELGTITDCCTAGDIAGDEAVGGLVGYSSVKITNCHSSVNVTGEKQIGGLVGVHLSGDITNCCARGDVVGSRWVGGLAGVVLMTGTEVTVGNCYAMGSVTGESETGGLIGKSMCTITNCYATGAVSGSLAGGLVGESYGTVANSYATGSVTGMNTGGLMGANMATLTSCYWDIETSGEPNMCANRFFDCDPNYGKTTAEMKQQSTFQDWDFINVWDIGENQTYPYLRVYLAGDINKDGIVNFLDLSITANQWMEEQ